MTQLAQPLSYVQLLLSVGFPRQEPAGEGCHFLLQESCLPRQTTCLCVARWVLTTQPPGETREEFIQGVKEEEEASGFTVAGTLVEQAEISTI